MKNIGSFELKLSEFMPGGIHELYSDAKYFGFRMRSKLKYSREDN